MTVHLLQAGADANIRSKKGSTVFDALFRDHNYLPPSWDGFKTAKLLINGLDRWKPKERKRSLEVNPWAILDIFSRP